MDEKLKSVHQTVTEVVEEPHVVVPNEKRAPPPPSFSKQQWSQPPNTLEERSTFTLLYDIALLVIPVLLLLKVGLVIIAWYIDRDHIGNDIDLISRLTKVVIQINGQMITIFTIVFVTVVSTLVKRYALYKAQRGAYITELEQYQGSVSLPSTFKLIWSLRAYRFRSLVLVVIWCFQYLGSQASKYEFRYVDSGKFYKSIVAVRGPNTPSWLNPAVPYPGSDIAESNDAGYKAAMYQPNIGPENGPHPGIDNAGQALVPDLDRILRGITVTGEKSQAPQLKPDFFGWYDVSAQSNIVKYAAYTSAVGYKILSEDCYYDQCLGDYTWQPDYLDISCSTPILQPFEAFPSDTLGNQSVSMNMTAITASTPRDAFGHPLRSFELWVRWPEGDTCTANTSGAAMSVCNVTRITVDMKVACLPNGCLPRKMRWLNAGTKEAATSYSTPFDDDGFAANFFTRLLLIDGKQDYMEYALQVASEVSPIWTICRTIGADNYTPEAYDKNPSFSNSLHAQMNKDFNTYYMLSQSYTATSPNYTLIRSQGYDSDFNSTILKGAKYQPQYAIAWEWIAIDFVSCLVLLFAAVASAILRMWTIAPDILGTVSSLTRDNPYLDLPDSGTTLDGLTRCRMLKDVKVRLCDVSSPGEQLGKIGLARVNSDNVQATELRKTTQYV